MKWLQLLAVLSMVLFCGCKNEAEEKEKGGLNIEFPGGSVKIGEDGVDVKAPGVDVQVDQDRVDVDAPNVGVQVDRDKKVGVQAPGVDLNIKSGGSDSR